MEDEPEPPLPWLQILSPHRTTIPDNPTSPEFEFQNLPIPTSPLLSADQLFSHGFLLPLHLLHLPIPPPEIHHSNPIPQSISKIESSHQIPLNSTSNSNRWRRIFKKAFTSPAPVTGDVKPKKPAIGVPAPELNINLWPFSRSKSAGGNRRRAAAAPSRKVSSAPCSRSNSGGESKLRKWVNSPSRGAGVYIGRSSPVWQVRRAGAGDGAGGRKEGKKGSGAWMGMERGKGLSLNVPMCIGYRRSLGCRSESGGGGGGVAGAGDGAGKGVSRSNLFNLRNLFNRKVY